MQLFLEVFGLSLGTCTARTVLVGALRRRSMILFDSQVPVASLESIVTIGLVMVGG